MDWVIVAGVTSLGAILGWMGYVAFVGQSNIKGFTAIVAVFGGAAVAGIFQAIAGTKAALPREVWFYPVGLLAGVVVSAGIAGYRRKQEARARDAQRAREQEALQREQEREEKIQESARARKEQFKTQEA